MSLASAHTGANLAHSSNGQDLTGPAISAFISFLGCQPLVVNPPFCDDAYALQVALEHDAAEAGGNIAEIIYAASIYAEVDLPPEHANAEEVRAFVRKCWESVQIGERMARLKEIAGQKHSSDYQDEEDHAVEVRRIALTCKKSIRAKLAAEEHRNPKSKDWASAPDGARGLYRRILTMRMNRRDEVTIAMLGTYDQTALDWLTGCRYLIQRLDAELLVMPDRTVEYDDEENWERYGGRWVNLRRDYPGWEGGDPFVGRTWGQSLDDIVLDVYVPHTRQGHFPNAREVAHEINTLHDLGDHRPVSIRLVQLALKRLKDAGRLVTLVPAEKYRSDHAWVNVAAKLGAPEDFPLAARAHALWRRQLPEDPIAQAA